MALNTYWCEHCRIPVFGQKNCPVCNKQGKMICVNGICNPVYYQERKLITYILDRDVTGSNVWYLGSSHYFIDGERIRVPYVQFFEGKKHLEISEELRKDIVLNDEIPNQELFIEANASYLNKLVYEAESYVEKMTKEYPSEGNQPYVPTVSFSGGKDSTVVSRLVKDALQNESVIHFFGDTTLEFPSTHIYVEEMYRKENPFTPMIPSETENDFFKLCKVFGPPSRFERWCCTIFKTSNLNMEYQNLNGNSLTFLGIRRSESKERQNYERTQTHSKIGSQVNCMPIIEWYDCDVWLYILSKGICFNPAYRFGYKRVGCWCCPNNSDWSTMLTEIYYPDLSRKWKDMLYDFARKTNKENVEDYVENGRWKTRRGASGLEVRNAPIIDTPCNLSDRARNIIIKKKLNPSVIEFFKPFGKLTINETEKDCHILIQEQEGVDENGIFHKTRKVGELIIVWGTNVVKVLPEKGIDPIMLVTRLKMQLRKYQYCIRCTACDSICPRSAITTIGQERYSINEEKCYQNTAVCARCISKFDYGCITCQVLSGKNEPENGV